MKYDKNEIIQLDYLEKQKQYQELDLNYNIIRQFNTQLFVIQNLINCLKINRLLIEEFLKYLKLLKLLV
ncbi:unnamed protein product [Paramecium pentaurelia]|uniref:Uncharacterized protein n=1 Tax=Paramecium pentaurelia TaxID=43138 RepID=A0A8S1V599_9CILI|nr:unnamed protein product [Paramecium pentaurelia]